MAELFLVWGQTEAVWNTTDFNWDEIRVTVGGKGFYAGDSYGFGGNQIKKLKKKNRFKEEEEDLIVVVVRSKDKRHSSIKASLIQARMTAELVDKEKFQIHIIDESRGPSAEIFYDSEAQIKAEVLHDSEFKITAELI